MRHTWHRLRQWLRNDSGASLIEYALLIGLLALVCFASLKFFGTQTSGRLKDSCSKIEAAQSGPAGTC